MALPPLDSEDWEPLDDTVRLAGEPLPLAGAEVGGGSSPGAIIVTFPTPRIRSIQWSSSPSDGAHSSHCRPLGRLSTMECGVRSLLRSENPDLMWPPLHSEISSSSSSPCGTQPVAPVILVPRAGAHIRRQQPVTPVLYLGLRRRGRHIVEQDRTPQHEEPGLPGRASVLGQLPVARGVRGYVRA